MICYSRNNITLGLYNTFAEVFSVCFCQKHVPVKCNCHIPPLNPSFRSLLLFHRTPIQFPCNMKRVRVWNQRRQKNPPRLNSEQLSVEYNHLKCHKILNPYIREIFFKFHLQLYSQNVKSSLMEHLYLVELNGWLCLPGHSESWL